MDKKKKKKKASRAVPIVLSESEIRRRIYIKAMQSDRFTVLIGPTQIAFQIPQELLIQHSLVFKNMCLLPFKESVEKTIILPEEKPATFANFFIWLHALEPRMTIDQIEPVVDLAIFAEKYHICCLKNQTSDVLWAALGSKQWRVTPEIITAVYSSVPAGTTLRKICSQGFAADYSSSATSPWSRRNTATESCAEWENVFNDFPDLGWEYFQHIQRVHTDVSFIKFGGACRFHDHSDIFGWVRGSDSTCPYPYGVPLTMREYKKSFGDMLDEPVDGRTKDIRTVDEALAVPTDQPAEQIDIVDEAPLEPADEPAEQIDIDEEATLPQPMEPVDESIDEIGIEEAAPELTGESAEDIRTMDEAPTASPVQIIDFGY